MGDVLFVISGSFTMNLLCTFLPRSTRNLVQWFLVWFTTDPEYRI